MTYTSTLPSPRRETGVSAQDGTVTPAAQPFGGIDTPLAVADRPVLVDARAADATPASVAVVAVDFSPASLRAAKAVLPTLAPGARLIVVHVKKGAAPGDENVGWWNDAYERRCADRFAQFIRRLPARPDVTIESKFLRGDIVPTVVEYAAAQGATLIACGRLGHSLVERVFVGSVSSALIQHATCPVLVAPELPDDAVWSRSAELHALQGA